MAASFDGDPGRSGAPAAVAELEPEGEPGGASGAPRVTLDDVLAGPAAEAAAPAAEAAAPAAEAAAPAAEAAAPPPARGAQPLGAAMRTARVAAVAGRRARLVVRGAAGPVEALVAPEVDPEVIADAHARGDAVLVELCEGEPPLIVGALTTQRPKALHLKAATITIEGEQELLLRSGRGAVRIREDGDIEVVGSRISAASRGLFRIVGRLLRLN
ncbi:MULTISPECIES: hypothetical protein [Sorangium]|uniref:Uncharacterized protein n=1 Tax=Sorangium cellulosum TaxID=56 RepID=A0A4V0NG39_SORCE|nr:MULTISPECIES: hypothetical protein [Sorangium]AUX31832.1 uncharacterized protein SOCE836_039650 [Sorangium cellulosum]WCQ91207.1 hypothetical protein NQZ70_03922 [Sorangium sp. Soce836]